MTDGEILAVAREVGWNTEHKASNDYLVRFARALMDKRWVALTDAELAEFSDAKLGSYDLCLEVEAKLKEKNT